MILILKCNGWTSQDSKDSAKISMLASYHFNPIKRMASLASFPLIDISPWYIFSIS